MMELVNMNSLGLFGLKPYPFKSGLPYEKIKLDGKNLKDKYIL